MSDAANIYIQSTKPGAGTITNAYWIHIDPFGPHPFWNDEQLDRRLLPPLNGMIKFVLDGDPWWRCESGHDAMAWQDESLAVLHAIGCGAGTHKTHRICAVGGHSACAARPENDCDDACCRGYNLHCPRCDRRWEFAAW